MAEIAQVPTSLGAVLDALEADHDFLTVGNVFTPDLIETWVDFKRVNEIAPVQAAPAPARVRACTTTCDHLSRSTRTRSWERDPGNGATESPRYLRPTSVIFRDVSGRVHVGRAR
ncbi:hypothetical protein [Nocardioides convexus]|uniref:hypothetical protein n=1 Tax=Nocardioides convexus TaxID=2712224 RepID=UPI00241865CC|nr:hypothetical protein [Nocardioides convexus]